MINSKEFYENVQKFDVLESRANLYPMFQGLIKNGFKTESFLLMLSTWNFASFRYAMKDFDLPAFERTISSLEKSFNQFEGKSLKTIPFNEYEPEVKHIFDELSAINGIKYTGASKLMHLSSPEVFMMWDDYIRKAYGFKEGNSENYFDFLKLMQQESKKLIGIEGKTLAKCVDEYNYVEFTLPALEINRKKEKERQRKAKEEKAGKKRKEIA